MLLNQQFLDFRSVANKISFPVFAINIPFYWITILLSDSIRKYLVFHQ